MRDCRAGLVNFIVRWADLIALAVLACAGLVVWLSGGVDGEQFLNADTLYPELIQHFETLHFRPPPSNNWFPDVMMHSLLHATGLVDPADPFTRKLVVGVFLFVVTAFLIGLYQGVIALYAFLALQLVSAFYHFDTTAHFSLALCTLLILIARNVWLRRVLLFLGVYSDLLLLIPIIIYHCLSRGQFASDATPKSRGADITVILIAVSLNIFYSEFSQGLVMLLPVLLGFAIAADLARRWGLVWWFAIGFVTLLVVTSLVGFVPSRYGAAVASSVVVVLFWIRPIMARDPYQMKESLSWSWRIPTATLVYLAVFFSLLDSAGVRQRSEQFACLATELHKRGISSVATDHWTSKPLYYGALQAATQLTISQVNFEKFRSYMWMAPYEFRGKDTQWAIRNTYACERFTTEPKYCGQASWPQLKPAEAVCNIFTLHQYEKKIPVTSGQKLSNKLDYTMHHFRHYVGVFFDRYL
ncbi:MAG: hypothetical protein WBD13_15050 [Burkholderiaceae bacterium]